MSAPTSPRRRRAGGPLAAARRLLTASPRSEQRHALLQAQNEILASMAKGAKLKEILDHAVSALERQVTPALCSIMRLDPTDQGLCHVAGRNLPMPLIKALERSDGETGEAGAVAEKSVFVRDMALLDEASARRGAALAAGFRAWWSEPVIAQAAGVLGTINLFYPEPGLPSRRHRSVVAFLRPVIALAIEFDRRALALHAADERFTSLAAGIPGVVYQRVVTPEGDIRYTYISEGVRDLYGVSPQQILADPQVLFDRYGANGTEEFRDRLIAASRRLEMWDVETTIVGADGRQKFIHAFARPHRQPDGSVIWNGLILDQTRVKQAEMEAAAAEARTRDAIIESLSQGLVMFNDQDRLTICNSAFRKLLPPLAAIAVSGAAYANIIRAEIGLHAPGAEPESAEEKLAARLHQHTLRHHAFEKQLADGRWILVSERRTADHGVVLLYADITKFKEKEEERRNLQDQFYRAQKLDAMGRLAGSIAHDFNNILASILGNATFLVEDLPPEAETYEFARQIVTAGERAKTLVQQILMFSRHQSSDHETLDPRAIVTETGQLLRAALPSSIGLNVRMPPFAAAISGNATQLVQVLMNLCVNARDAIGERHGAIDLEAELVSPEAAKAAAGATVPAKAIPGDSATCLWFGKLEAGHSYLRIRVRDSGCGMERDVMEKMFEPFFTTKEVGRGTGLGLAAVHGIIAAHHGIMAVTSQPGNGTCFDIFLPVRMAVPSEAGSAAPQIAPLGSEAILVVDDEDQVSAVVARSLARLGYQVECFNDAVAALAAFAASPDKWSAVITDQTMPNMTGCELAQAIGKRAPGLPVILCSGYADGISADAAKAIGIQAVLTKPVEPTSLARTVRNLLDEGSGRRPAAPQSGVPSI